MGIGKAAIALILTGVLAFGLVAAFSIASESKPNDGMVCNSTQLCNGTVTLSETIGTQTANLMVPAMAAAGILFLFAVLAFLRRSGS